jgi:hypothetical protein
MEGAVLTAVLVLSAVVGYLAPSIVAFARAVPGTPSIVKLNVLHGWTIIGWARALVLALRHPPASFSRGHVPALPPSPQWHAPLASGRLSAPGRMGNPPPLSAAGRQRLRLRVIPGPVPVPPPVTATATVTAQDRGRDHLDGAW